MTTDRAKIPSLYDADAEQIITLDVRRRVNRILKSYKVAHTIACATDEEYLIFDKGCNVRVVTHPDRTVETIDDGDAAAHKLYDVLLRNVEGWGDPGGKNVDDEQKRRAIFRNLFVCAIVPPAPEAAITGDVDAEKPWETADEPAAGSVGLRCLFNGQELVTRHFMRPPSAEQQKRHESLTSRKSYQAGARLRRNIVVIPSTAKALGKLYDELCEKSEGYGGRVPLWHKLAIVGHVFRDAEESEGED